MVSKITSGHSIRGALNYNENKVKEGKAELIVATNYHKDADKLSFHEKLARLEHQANLNERVEHKCIHISINLDPSENFSNEFFKQLASEYMEMIGLSEQPYLLYRHYDAAHPHIHIVTTAILPDGKQKNLHNLGRKESFSACRELERRHHLVVADKKQRKILHMVKPVEISPVVYGVHETKAAIAKVLHAVLGHYNFSTLAELNAVLKQYNIVADPGGAGSRMEKFRGLVYSVINSEEEKIGVPIKSSKFHFKAKLVDLEELFIKGEQKKKKLRAEVKADVRAVLQTSNDKNDFIDKLAQRQIKAAFRENAQGLIYGVTFIDSVRGCVFKGSDLSDELSCKQILDRLDRPYLQQLKDYHFNKQLSAGIINETDFTTGFPNVITEWASKGLLISTSNDEKGEFKMGHINTSIASYCPAPKKISNYLLANGMTMEKTNGFRKAVDKVQSKLHIDFKKGIPSLMPPIPIHILFPLIAPLFEPTDYDPVDGHWLRESRKKRKRQRPS